MPNLFSWHSQIREDTMGNIYGRLPGSDPAAAAVATGSHTDAIPGAGAYDGTVGELRCCAKCLVLQGMNGGHEQQHRCDIWGGGLRGTVGEMGRWQECLQPAD